MPLISVVIPTYNSEKTIKKTIESVLEQSFIDLELIIINDGYMDSTLKVISQFKDSRIKVFLFENVGGNVSRNRGLERSTGEFVSFLDADDIWTPDKLESQLHALKANPQAAVAYSWTDYIDEQGKFLLSGTHITANGNVYEQLIISNFLENGSNPLIRREALVQLGGFDEELTAAQDWDMWLRLAQNFDFFAVPRVQILYRMSANSLSTNLARQEKASLQVLEKACSKNIQDLNRLKKKSLTNLYKYLTCKALQQPFTRQKGLAAARFLSKYIFYDASRLKSTNLIVKLSFKIALIVILPCDLSTTLLAHMKTNN
ncbi:MAG: glycosyltransferase [Pelatocladus maniniholoensis HA4357-MV3]|jgi:glycosyltransferase involved in cell wall biosynthesis|uniref:Glycosyltransferase n=1 Tax=Pelatocladus maniniholoensis HA4357-MV3 TaxID=1117104 RepID=A0A9E3H4F0_9NOST|nr:glycosyltransferase [Pelatocladus maniniholoensis HA4357-MV3]